MMKMTSFDDDEYDDEYEEKPKKSIFRREKTHDESDEDDYELPAKSQQRPARSNNKVTRCVSQHVAQV